jgi:hypothetical protein
MFPNAAPTRPTRPILPAASPVSNWNVVLYRKAEAVQPSHTYDLAQTQVPYPVYGSFYIQLQQQACASSPSRSDVLCLRYQSHQQKNTVDSYTLPFTISQLSDVKLSPDSVPLSSSMSTTTSSKFYNTDQQSVRKFNREKVSIKHLACDLIPSEGVKVICGERKLGTARDYQSSCDRRLLSLRPTLHTRHRIC